MSSKTQSTLTFTRVPTSSRTSQPNATEQAGPSAPFVLPRKRQLVETQEPPAVDGAAPHPADASQRVQQPPLPRRNSCLCAPLATLAEQANCINLATLVNLCIFSTAAVKPARRCESTAPCAICPGQGNP